MDAPSSVACRAGPRHTTHARQGDRNRGAVQVVALPRDERITVDIDRGLGHRGKIQASRRVQSFFPGESSGARMFSDA